MTKLRTIAMMLAAAALGALLSGTIGCGNSGASGDGDTDTDSDSDADAGDDAAADTDTDSDTDTDTDTDSDTDADCTDTDYPAGPYAWFLDGVVNDVTFPAIFDDAVTELVLSEIHCAEVKSLVFALGANT